MDALLKQVDILLRSDEDEHLEFKEAKRDFDFEKLVRYCVALANECGGKIILGVTDKKPRKVVDTKSFPDIQRTKAGLLERLHLRIEIDVIQHPDGRVIIVSVPSRPVGMPIEYRGSYWMRSGQELKPMSPDMLKRIFAEAQPDFSAEICPNVAICDLNQNAIESFRSLWIRRSGNNALSKFSHEQLLTDAELMIDGGVTYAALVLFGSRIVLGKHLAQSEIVFEYRGSEKSINYQQRKEYREGFLLFHDSLWETINLRNEKHHYEEGLFVWEIPSFNEIVIREAVLNAVSHRDYRLGGSVFIRQFPNKIEITSPGGFPPGISQENILWRQSPRNRRIAEAFAKCGLVERSGQGADRMFEASVREGKRLPDFSRSDDYQVTLILCGEVQDPLFLKFLEEISRKKQVAFSTNDLLLLDSIHRDQPIPKMLRDRVPELAELGIIEKVGRKYILSRHYYSFVGKKGVYTRKRGLDRETNKKLLLKHINDNKNTGSRFEELMDVLPNLTREQIKTLIRQMKQEKLIYLKGRTKAGRWYPHEKE
jgi:ATP-dependent DNA helicase RecG